MVRIALHVLLPVCSLHSNGRTSGVYRNTDLTQNERKRQIWGRVCFGGQFFAAGLVPTVTCPGVPRPGGWGGGGGLGWPWGVRVRPPGPPLRLARRPWPYSLLLLQRPRSLQRRPVSTPGARRGRVGGEVASGRPPGPRRPCRRAGAGRRRPRGSIGAVACVPVLH
jgi:hypothetical protein